MSTLPVTANGQTARMQMPSQAPPSGAPPAKLLPGMGSLHHTIATTNPEAQKFFDQGLTLVYAFNFLEAYHSFQRAAELDPREPMPHWGAALALGPNYNAGASSLMQRLAYREISKATELAAGAPQNEKDYVQALAQRYSNAAPPDQQQLANDYAAAMRGLSRKYPADPDAATLYAQSLMQLHPWHLWTAEGKPRENTEEIVAVLEDVLRRWPEHVGANHLYIHALEASPDPARALPSAKRLETLVPGAGHLVHMPSHIYIHTGDYAAAVKSNEDAVAADRVYLRERGIPNYPYVQSYVDHNFYFLMYAAMMDGQFQTAARAAEQLATDAAANPGLSMSQGFMSFRGLVLLRYARWDAVLKVPTPDAKMLFADFYWHFARGCALAAMGRPEPAETERQAMEERTSKCPPDQSLIYPRPAGKLFTGLHCRCSMRGSLQRIMTMCTPSGTGARRWQFRMPRNIRNCLNGTIRFGNHLARRCFEMGKPWKRKRCFVKTCGATA